MSGNVENPRVLVAVMVRVSDLLFQGMSLPAALSLCAKELEDYYEAHLHQPVVKFRLGPD